MVDTNVLVNEKASSDLVEKYVGMGFLEEHVLKGIKEIGYNDGDELLDHILTYKLLDDVGSCSTSGGTLLGVQDDNQEPDDDVDFDWDSDEAAGGRVPNSDRSGDEDFLQEMAQKDEKIKSLQKMGFTGDEADMTVTRCGVDAPLDVLVDFISASQHEGCFNSLGGRKKAQIFERINKRNLYGGGAQGNRSRRRLDGSMCLPYPMVGFSLPTDRHRLPPVNRTLPEEASGRPFFYYENVALAPKGTWIDISNTLYEVEPEFVDSKHLCATARKRGYIHNLPIEDRFLRPLPRNTILETFPEYREWWPAWDKRSKLNCLQTVLAPSTVTEWIRITLSRSSSPPPPNIQKQVTRLCSKWNLVWTGKNMATPLEPHEMEQLLGFPSGHTRGFGNTDRYKSLGNTFQVDTVTYHLSVLKSMFPNGMTVLSLFTGIGGAEVALHTLGIRMKAVVSVEISEVNRRIFKGWWDKTKQHGDLIDQFEDVEDLSNEMIESLTRSLGGFDLVIGVAPATISLQQPTPPQWFTGQAECFVLPILQDIACCQVCNGNDVCVRKAPCAAASPKP